MDKFSKFVCGPFYNVYMWNSLHSLCVEQVLMFTCGPIKMIVFGIVYHVYMWKIYNDYTLTDLHRLYVEGITLHTFGHVKHSLYVDRYTLFI